MAIEKIECVCGKCDVCGESFEHIEGWTIFVDHNQIKENMQDADWYVDGNKCYCDLCHYIDDEDILQLKQK